MKDRAGILVVDDDQLSRMILVRTLTEEGYRASLVDSGESALAAVDTEPPDLILLDIRLSGMDGLEVCRRLKTNKKTQGVPIILVSAFADAKEWMEGLELGAADFITKPFHKEELLARVKTHLSLSRAKSLLHENSSLADRSRQALLSALEDKKSSEMKYRSLSENSPDLIARFDRHGRHLYVNAAAVKAGLFTTQAVYIGKTIAESGVPEEEAAEMGQSYKNHNRYGQNGRSGRLLCNAERPPLLQYQICAGIRRRRVGPFGALPSP